MPSKKVAPTPLPCECGRAPGVAKVKAGRWIVTCTLVRGCTCNVAGIGKNRDAAVEDWNNRRLKNGN